MSLSQIPSPDEQRGDPNPGSGAPVPSAMSMIHLVKVYGQNVAVADLSLEIPKGSFYGIVGPNGAGKTTTLSMATGLLVPDRGTALIEGVDIWQDPQAAKKKLGVMPDGLRIFDRLSGPDYLTYVALLRGLSPQEAQVRTRDLLQALDLADVGRKIITDYSAGMAKKIALGAALIHSPHVVVLDEPFESVDPISSANIRSILQTFVASGGTVVLSSHVMATVEKLCDHVAIINRGQVVAAGTVEEVAAGEELETRFAQLVGAHVTQGGLPWLGS